VPVTEWRCGTGGGTPQQTLSFLFPTVGAATGSCLSHRSLPTDQRASRVGSKLSEGLRAFLWGNIIT